MLVLLCFGFSIFLSVCFNGLVSVRLRIGGVVLVLVLFWVWCLFCVLVLFLW